MFPIPPGRKLSFIEIAEYWSGEIKPPTRPQVLLIAIGQAWWRGELVAANGPSRLKVLRTLYSTCTDSIAFIIPDMTVPPQSKLRDDGGWEVFLRVPLPNADPDTWTEANCAEAFEVIAKAWDAEELFHLIAPLVAGIDLTQGEFNQWINEYKYQRPAFWGNAEQQPADKTVRHRRTKHVQWHIQRAVDALANEYGGKFPPPGMPVFERDRLIRGWLAGDDEPAKPPSERVLRDYFSEPRS
jgi:hypothetical protein